MLSFPYPMIICNEAAQKTIVYTNYSQINTVPNCLGDHAKWSEKWCSGKFDASNDKTCIQNMQNI